MRGRVFWQVITNVSIGGMAFETSGSARPTTQPDITENINFKLRRCEKPQISRFHVCFFGIY
jgi:hypothetical protein